MTAVREHPSTGVAPSPVEVLDRRLHVTTTKTWMVFIAVIVLLVVALVWAIFGSAPTEVKGQSMLLPPNGLYEVGVGTGGFVTDLLVKNGDHVEEGQALARLRRAQAFLRTFGVEIHFAREGRMGARVIRMRAAH